MMAHQDDLTNLNWVAGAPVPIPVDLSVSPPEEITSRSPVARTVIATTPHKATEPRATPTTDNYHPRQNYHTCTSNGESERRPRCSYTCLIGMAMKASPNTDGCLPVNEIYRYIEKEFPYFKTAPDGWKNSIRHNLSLNPLFRKVTRTDGWQGKKGFFWEMTPEKKHVIDEEVDKFLKQEGRELEPHVTSLSSPIPPHTRTPSKRPLSKAKCSTPKVRKASSNTPTKSPACQKKPLSDHVTKYSAEIQDEIINSQVPSTPTLSPTQPALDINNPPSSYIGINPPSDDPQHAASDLFGTDVDAHKSTVPYNGYDNVMPLYTPPSYAAVIGIPSPYMTGHALSPIMNFTPPTPLAPSFLPPQFFQYVPSSPYDINNYQGQTFVPQMLPYSQSSNGLSHFPTQAHLPLMAGHNVLLNAPVSVEVLDSSETVELADVVDFIDEACHESRESYRVSSNNHNTPRKRIAVTPRSSGRQPIPKRLRLNEEDKKRDQPMVQSQLRYLDNYVDKESVSVKEHDSEFNHSDGDDKVESDLLSCLISASERDEQIHLSSSSENLTLSHHQWNHLERIVGCTEIESLLNMGSTAKKSQCCLSESADGLYSSSIPRLESLLRLGDNNISSIERGLQLQTDCDACCDDVLDTECPIPCNGV